jgi:hypothetical protein
MCSACKECAFCPPKWIECWEPKKHLPGKKWKAELTEKVTSPEVVAWFKTCPNVTKRTTQGIKNEMYLQLCFQRKPVIVLNFASSTAPPVRQCVTQLADDAYTQDGTPDPITSEQKALLNTLNEILFSTDIRQRMAKPIEMEKVAQEGNAWPLKRLRAYLKKVLDILVPGHGKEALNFLLSQDRLRHPILFGEQGNKLLDNMARLYSITQCHMVQELMLLLMTGVITRKELNRRIQNALNTVEDETRMKPIGKYKFKTGSKCA